MYRYMRVYNMCDIYEYDMHHILHIIIKTKEMFSQIYYCNNNSNNNNYCCCSLKGCVYNIWC
jgi:hypothetical protein